MKKIIFALTLLFTLISCTNITENQKTATVHVSLSQYTPKTISPSLVKESSYQNVESWTITFSDKTAERDDIIYEGVTFSEATPPYHHLHFRLEHTPPQSKAQTQTLQTLFFMIHKPLHLHNLKHLISFFTLHPKK